eukprot:6111890-Amphidinium_carterae.1
MASGRILGLGDFGVQHAECLQGIPPTTPTTTARWDCEGTTNHTALRERVSSDPQPLDDFVGSSNSLVGRM